MENINYEATMYITDVIFERWARAYNPRKRYNLMSSNIAKAMNNAIKACRELLITGVIDYIRGVLQRWFYDRRTSAGKLKSTLTTKADVNIGVNDEKAHYITVYSITYYSFLVKDGDLDGTVDLTSKTCTSREFDMDEIPCEHALACIRIRRFSYADYCSPYYSSAFLVAAYIGEIHPVGHPLNVVVVEEDLKRTVFRHLVRELVNQDVQLVIVMVTIVIHAHTRDRLDH
ncbi:hypothetical protein Ddye_000266 [Dipteronia dyeriana]|uniref:Zinc finger PMZ-type domain-containing protein n=1 Tax=Dipteronia dyeriana TaxID=168575 RepID=A0AAE0CSD6_9ROSI|nr:hypothetical protein Ddye_000266 [Dipteronia dyeriana]